MASEAADSGQSKLKIVGNERALKGFIGPDADKIEDDFGSRGRAFNVVVGEGKTILAGSLPPIVEVKPSVPPTSVAAVRERLANSNKPESGESLPSSVVAAVIDSDGSPDASSRTALVATTGGWDAHALKIDRSRKDELAKDIKVFPSGEAGDSDTSPPDKLSIDSKAEGRDETDKAIDAQVGVLELETDTERKLEETVLAGSGEALPEVKLNLSAALAILGSAKEQLSHKVEKETGFDPMVYLQAVQTVGKEVVQTILDLPSEDQFRIGLEISRQLTKTERASDWTKMKELFAQADLFRLKAAYPEIYEDIDEMKKDYKEELA